MILAVLFGLTVTLPARAADEPQLSLGLLAGWGVLDRDLTGHGLTIAHGAQLGGLRGAWLLSDSWTLFGDTTVGRWNTAGDSPDVMTFSTRAGAEWLLPRMGERTRLYLAPAVGWSWFDIKQDDPHGRPRDFDRAIASLGFGQRFAGSGSTVWHWELRGETNVGSNGLDGERTTNAALLLGWSFGVPQGDDDNDGVANRRDACPRTPQGAIVDARGCPEDSDGDGVYDGLDHCPDTPRGVPVDADGCPRDTDGDGVDDDADACPNTPGGVAVDARGCPVDSDGDGVPDGIDRCANTPKGARVDERGCGIDSDGDGVYDGIDQCPDTPRGVKVDARGCPTQETAVSFFPAGETTLVLHGVFFASDRADLTEASRSVLDGVAVQLQAYPDVRVEVAGHTDSTNTEQHNQALSERRAESVRAYLESRGVAADRMTAHGYGESSPDRRQHVGRRPHPQPARRARPSTLTAPAVRIPTGPGALAPGPSACRIRRRGVGRASAPCARRPSPSPAR